MPTTMTGLLAGVVIEGLVAPVPVAGVALTMEPNATGIYRSSVTRKLVGAAGGCDGGVPEVMIPVSCPSCPAFLPSEPAASAQPAYVEIGGAPPTKVGSPMIWFVPVQPPASQRLKLTVQLTHPLEPPPVLKLDVPIRMLLRKVPFVVLFMFDDELSKGLGAWLNP